MGVPSEEPKELGVASVRSPLLGGSKSRWQKSAAFAGVALVLMAAVVTTSRAGLTKLSLVTQPVNSVDSVVYESCTGEATTCTPTLLKNTVAYNPYVCAAPDEATSAHLCENDVCTELCGSWCDVGAGAALRPASRDKPLHIAYYRTISIILDTLNILNTRSAHSRSTRTSKR